MDEQPRAPRRRRITEDDLDRVREDSRAASVGSLKDLEFTVATLAGTQQSQALDIAKIKVAVMGEPGVSKGALAEIRESIERSNDENKAFRASLPEMIAGAIQQERNRRGAAKLAGMGRGAWALVLAGFGSSFGTLMYLLVNHPAVHH